MVKIWLTVAASSSTSLWHQATSLLLAPQQEALTVTSSTSNYNHDLFKALIAPPIKKTSLKLKKRMHKRKSSKGGTQAQPQPATQLGIRAFLSRRQHGPMGKEDLLLDEM